MENHHFYYKWPFSIAMLVHQRVSSLIPCYNETNTPSVHQPREFFVRGRPCLLTTCRYGKLYPSLVSFLDICCLTIEETGSKMDWQPTKTSRARLGDRIPKSNWKSATQKCNKMRFHESSVATWFRFLWFYAHPMGFPSMITILFWENKLCTRRAGQRAARIPVIPGIKGACFVIGRPSRLEDSSIRAACGKKMARAGTTSARFGFVWK